jgi:hypothetical protein
MSEEATLAASRGGTGLDMSASTGFVKVAAGTFSAAANVDLATDVTGALPEANGGVGEDVSSAANGELMIGDGSGLTKATITGTADQVVVTNGSGSITLSTPQSINTTSNVTFGEVTADTSVKYGDTGGGTNYVTVQAPSDANLTSDYTITLPVDDGTSNQVLQTDGNGVTTWATVGGATIGVATKAVGDSPYTVLTSDRLLLCDDSGGSVTFNLPTAVGNTGQIFEFKKTATGVTNICTIDGSTTETIDGSLTKVLDLQYQSFEIVSDGANWVVVDEDIPTVAVRYETNASQSIDNAAEEIVDFEDLVYETHSGLVSVGASWDFTCPIAGKYKVSSVINFAATDYAIGTFLSNSMGKNSTTDSIFGGMEIIATETNADTVILGGSTTVDCAKNDTIEGTAFQNSGGAVALTSTASRNYIAIERVK